VPAALAQGGKVRAIVLPSADPALRLAGWQVNPGREQALLYFGGNGERVEDNAAFFRDCLPNHTVFLIGYRGYGDSDGAPSQAALFADALALEARLRAEGFGQMDAMGRSLGTGVAVHLASQRPIRRLLLLTPYDSIAAVAQGHFPLFPVRWLSTEPFDSLGIASKVKSDVALLVAGRDQVIPPSHAAALAAAFHPTPTVIHFPTADHNTISAQPGYAEAVCGFLRG
jgi:uncharacterized protein